MGLFAVLLLLSVLDVIAARSIESSDNQTKVASVIRDGQDGKSTVSNSNTKDIISLKSVDLQLSELQNLIIQQGFVLKELIKNQQKLLKERERNRKRQRYVKKYLRKIYEGCRCQSPWSGPKKLHQNDDAARSNDSDVAATYPRNNIYVTTKAEDGITKQTTLSPATTTTEQQTASAIKSDYIYDEEEYERSTPALTIFNKPYGHVDRYVAEAAPAKEFNHSVSSENNDKIKTLSTYEEPAALQDDSENKMNYETDQTSVTAINLIPNSLDMTIGRQRKWPDEARYLMGPYTGEFDVIIDLAQGRVTGNHSSIKILESPYPGIASYCIQQGLVKLSFGKPGSALRHNAVLIDLTFNRPTQWVFNIGDSSSNDGRSGDSNTQENDSEVDGYGSTFSVFGSDKSHDPWRKRLFLKEDFIQERLSIVIANEVVVWNNYAGNFDFVKDPSLFALNGQSDVQGSVNYDIFLGLNRVIAGNYRSGHGLCSAALKWL